MRTKQSSGNPFSAGRYAWAWQQVHELRPASHLDIGCFDGAWLHSLSPLGVAERVGVDVNAEAIAAGRRRYPDLDLRHTVDVCALPIADAAFDSVSLLDVYEHLDLATQQGVMREIWRVLRPGGALLITVPRQHAFSVLDTGNFKFRLPALHRWFVSMRHGRQHYQQRYEHNPHGLVGDVMATKRWHEHFSAAGLATILRRHGFSIAGVDGSGLFMRPLLLVSVVSPGKLRAAVRRLISRDEERFASANLFIRAVKPATPSAAGTAERTP